MASAWMQESAGIKPNQRGRRSVRPCSRHGRRRCSTVPGLLVQLDAESVHQLVEASEQVHDSHEFEDAFVVQPKLPHRGSVHLESINTRVYGRDGDRDDLL